MPGPVEPSPFVLGAGSASDGMSRRSGGRHPKVRMRVEPSASRPLARQCRQARLGHDSAAGIGCGAGLGDQAEFAGLGDGFGAVSRAELGEDVADVLFDGVEGDHEAVGDALI